MSDAQCSVSGIEMPVIGNVADCFWNKIGMKGVVGLEFRCSIQCLDFALEILI